MLRSGWLGMPSWAMNSTDLAVVQRSDQLRAASRQLGAESHQPTKDLRDTYMEVLNDIKNARDGQFLTPRRPIC